MTTKNTITAMKANRLFWLGRYTERVYLSLHFLRRYYDKMIDGTPEEYCEYCKKLDLSNPYSTELAFRLGYLYDELNPCSIFSSIERAHDNAIVLREEIMSETFSYVSLSRAEIMRYKQANEDNITTLQNITDYMLAFWGSVDERVYNPDIRMLLKVGRLVESIDLHVRFEYSYARVRELFDFLLWRTQNEDELLDGHILQQLDSLLSPQCYNPSDVNYKVRILKYLNQLVLL